MGEKIYQISTTALAKKHNFSDKEMFTRLSDLGLIEKKGDHWSLTNKGDDAGGIVVNSKKYGKYITWPENLRLDNQIGEFITAKIIGSKFQLDANMINYIFSEIGWLYKDINGWKLTPQGIRSGGVQDEDKRTGTPFVRWPKAIIESKIFLNSIEAIKGTKAESKTPGDEEKTGQEELICSEKKVTAQHRATDGHIIRSKAEVLIDNWLYMAEIVHAYERKLPVSEEVYSDFYIPTAKVYIEYWGYENDQKYLNRKKVKQEIYEKYGLNLIELEDKDIQHLDDILPKKLREFGIQAY